MKKIRIVLAMVLVLTLVFGMLSGAVAEGEDAIFTISVVPVGTKTELNAEIVDAEIGGTVTMDVMLTNNDNSVTPISAFGVDILIDESLSFKTIEWAIEGFPAAETRPNRPDKVRLSFFSGGDEGIINIAAGGSAKLCTLTLDVASSGLSYGDQIGVAVENNNFLSVSITDLVDEFVPSTINGIVEIVTKYSITWTGLAGNDETIQVGAGLIPTHDVPVKAGYTFIGWKDNNEVVTPAGTPLPAVLSDMTYTAQWEPTEYTVTFAEGTSFGDATPPATYTIESGIAVTPIRGGCTFLGWSAEPITPEDTDYNWNTVTAPIANSDTVGLYGDVKLTPVWEVNADAVFAEYAYAATGDLLLLVGVSGIEDANAVFYNGSAMFYTEDQHYLALLNAADDTINGVNGNGKPATQYERAYLYLIPETATAAEVKASLSIDVGTNQAVRRDGNVNCDNKGLINSGDYGLVDGFLAHRQINGVTVQMRLEADVKTSRYNIQCFGNIADIAEIISMAPDF